MKKSKPIGKVVEWNLDELNTGGGLSFTVWVDPKGMRSILSKIIGMKKYERTEFLFPKKKRRGTMRRQRAFRRWLKRFEERLVKQNEQSGN
jgi:hypothetical protein